MPIPFLRCMVLVAAWNHLPPRVLPAIQAVEGGRTGLVHHNKDGSDDLGLMQVNSIWIAPLARYTGKPSDVTRSRLLNNACFSIAASGAILKLYLSEEKGDLLRAVGDYHSHTPSLNAGYRLRVVNAARFMFVTPQASRH